MRSACQQLGHYWISIAVSSDGKMITQMCKRCTKGRTMSIKELEERRCQQSEASPAA